MRLVILLCFCFFSLTSHAQITFEKGYIVNNSGNKIPAWIKYLDWKSNPSEITYKKTDEGPVIIGDMENIAAFGVDSKASYLRATVPVDNSSTDLKRLSNHSRFEFEEKTVFLKILVEGSSDLLQYSGGGIEQFYLRQDGENELQPLIFKRYIPESSTSIMENNQYQQQLYNAMSCENLDRQDFERTDYSQKDLVKLFQRYNECKGTTYTNFTQSAERDAFNLRIRPGINFSTMTMTTYTVYRRMNFGQKSNFRLGIEGEYIMPFLRDKWSFIVEPTYQYYKSEAVFPDAQFGDGTVEVQYNSLEIPFGVRYYMYLNESNRLFLNATYTVDLIIGDSGFDFDTNISSFDKIEIETNTGTNFSFGGGFNHKKFSVEARYHFGRTLTGKKMVIGTDYKTFSIILGYQLL